MRDTGSETPVQNAARKTPPAPPFVWGGELGVSPREAAALGVVERRLATIGALVRAITERAAPAPAPPAPVVPVPVTSSPNRERIQREESPIVAVGLGNGPARGFSRQRLEKHGLLSLALAVAREHGCELDQIMGRGRRKRTAAARHHLCAALRALGRFSLPEIGIIVGRDHTTAMSSVQKWAREVGPVDPALLALVDPHRYPARRVVGFRGDVPAIPDLEIAS